MIDFRPVNIEDKKTYNEYLFESNINDFEYSFSNVFMWGQQNIAFLHNHIVLYSLYDCQCFYPFPIGVADKKEVLDAILADANERNVCPCLLSLNENAKRTLEQLYPNQFYFHADRNNYDYVYDIHDLADLKGRKYAKKRNHLKHFIKNHEDYTVTPITMENMDPVRAFVSDWYAKKQTDNPDGDYHFEQAAMEKVFLHYDALGMEGLLLEEHGEVLGFTMGSQIAPDTFDVHFEKAYGDIDGAYTTITSEFAKYIRDKYPHIQYLDREEDMGIPGLRKAKSSYFPHHLVKKYKAFPLNYSFDFDEPDATMLPQLRNLWKESFGDSDEFLDAFYTTAFDKARCRMAYVNNDTSDISENSEKHLAAVLYWFDCTIDDQRVAYVYAVSTAKPFRGNGACHMLLADTHKHLKHLGYDGVILVPGNDALASLYEGCEYEPCTRRSRIECAGKDMEISIREIGRDEFSTLRRELLPAHSVIQESENLDFLATQAKFYTGEAISSSEGTTCKKSFVLCANIENENLYGVELLGDSSLAPGIVHSLGCKDGTFFIPGKDEPFAMFYALSEDGIKPSYFGFAYD